MTTPTNWSGPVDLNGPCEAIAWTEDFVTGVPGIDSDHQRLLALFNEFRAAVIGGKGELAIARILDELVGYTQYHFEREELMMRESQYPEYPRHKKMHDGFVSQIADVRHHLTGGSDMSTFLLSFLARWLGGHILGADRKLGHFLIGKEFIEH